MRDKYQQKMPIIYRNIQAAEQQTLLIDQEHCSIAYTPFTFILSLDQHQVLLEANKSRTYIKSERKPSNMCKYFFYFLAPLDRHNQIVSLSSGHSNHCSFGSPET